MGGGSQGGCVCGCGIKSIGSSGVVVHLGVMRLTAIAAAARQRHRSGRATPVIEVLRRTAPAATVFCPSCSRWRRMQTDPSGYTHCRSLPLPLHLSLQNSIPAAATFASPRHTMYRADAMCECVSCQSRRSCGVCSRPFQQSVHEIGPRKRDVTF